LQQTRIAELAASGRGGIAGAHALAREALGEETQVGLHLFVEFVVYFSME
jgi:hypothetical protein